MAMRSRLRRWAMWGLGGASGTRAARSRHACLLWEERAPEDLIPGGLLARPLLIGLRGSAGAAPGRGRRSRMTPSRLRIPPPPCIMPADEALYLTR